MRFLLDTNILIPLEDSQRPLVPSLTSFVRLANLHGHVLLYHPASEDDVREDRNIERRDQTLQRLAQYERLDARPVCPWNAAAGTRATLRDYMSGLEQGVALLLGQRFCPNRILSPKDVFGDSFVAPQSFRYLRAEEIDAVVECFGSEK